MKTEVPPSAPRGKGGKKPDKGIISLKKPTIKLIGWANSLVARVIGRIKVK